MQLALRDRYLEQTQQMKRKSSPNEIIDLDEVTKQPTQKKRKSQKKPSETGEFRKYIPEITLADIGGDERLVNLAWRNVLFPIKTNSIAKLINKDHSSILGVLLYGPPGCGKTMLARAIAGEMSWPIIEVGSTEIVSGMSGESENKVRKLFKFAEASSPCILFLDEIDAIASSRDLSSRGMEKRIVTQLLTSMESLRQDRKVIVIGATNRQFDLDPALRRSGRFSVEIPIGYPNAPTRSRILETLLKNIQSSKHLNTKKIGDLTNGFVGADLKRLLNQAVQLCIERSVTVSNPKRFSDLLSVSRIDVIRKYMEGLSIFENSSKNQQFALQTQDFVDSIKYVQPSSKREGFAVIPANPDGSRYTWNDVKIDKSIKQDIFINIVHKILHPALYESLGRSLKSGILLHGPPGCGKTSIARAIASTTHASFISVKGPELLNKYVGESERAVRIVFERARNSAPCIIFFDEIDGLATTRESDGSGGSSVNIVHQLLSEMDGFGSNNEVYLIGSTNRLDKIDPAFLRGGRFGNQIKIPLPSEEIRRQILNHSARRIPKAKNVNLATIAKRTAGFSGADCVSIVDFACDIVINDHLAAKFDGDEYKMDQMEQHIDVILTQESLLTGMHKVYQQSDRLQELTKRNSVKDF